MEIHELYYYDMIDVKVITGEDETGNVKFVRHPTILYSRIT